MQLVFFLGLEMIAMNVRGRFGPLALWVLGSWYTDQSIAAVVM